MVKKRRLLLPTLLAAGAVLASVALVVLIRRAGHVGLSGSTETESEVEPHIAQGPDGTLAVAWMGVRGHQEDQKAGSQSPVAANSLGVRVSRDSGRSWGSVLRLEEPGRYVADPVLVPAPNSVFDLVWLSYAQVASGGDRQDKRVVTTRLQGSPVKNGAITAVSSPEQGQVDKPWAVRGPEGTLLVVYRFSRIADAGIELARVAKDDVSRKTIVHHSGFKGGQPTVCAAPNDSRVWVAYVDPQRGAILLSGEDKGTVWTETRVSREGESVAKGAPWCAAYGQSLWVLYGIEARPGDPQLSAILSHAVIARSDDQGRTFQARSEVRDGSAVLLHPTLGLGNAGSPRVAWYAGQGEGDHHARLLFGELREDGSLEGQALVVREGLLLASSRNDPSWVGDYMAITSGSERGWIAFSDNRSGRSHIDVVSVP